MIYYLTSSILPFHCITGLALYRLIKILMLYLLNLFMQVFSIEILSNYGHHGSIKSVYY